MCKYRANIQIEGLEPRIAEYVIPKFPRRDSEPKKRLRENEAIIDIKHNNSQYTGELLDIELCVKPW